MRSYILWIFLALLSSNSVFAQIRQCLTDWTYLADQDICYYLSGDGTTASLANARTTCEAFDAPDSRLALEENAIEIVADIDDPSAFTGCYRLEAFQRRVGSRQRWFQLTPPRERINPRQAVNNLRGNGATLCIMPQDGSYDGQSLSVATLPYICQATPFKVTTTPPTTTLPTTTLPTTIIQVTTNVREFCDEEDDGWFVVPNEDICAKIFTTPTQGFWNAWDECRGQSPAATLLRVPHVLKFFDAIDDPSMYPGRFRINGYQRAKRNRVVWREAESMIIRRPLGGLLEATHPRNRGTLTLRLRQQNWYGDNDIGTKLGFVCERPSNKETVIP